MGHKHTVHDTDAHFIIDPITRAIKNAVSKKATLVQGDHNSERYTFEIPRYVEEHDMSQCNAVEVHYLNLDSKTGQIQKGIYTVEDLRLSEDGEKVLCSWLISENATQFKGALNFLLRYKCVEDGIKTYAWNTAFYIGMTVSEGSDAAETFESDYADIIEQWKESVMQEFKDDLNQWKSTKERELHDSMALWQSKASENLDEWKTEQVNEVHQVMGDHEEYTDKRMAVLEGRMDTFASLEEGSTTGDAELQDLRVDIDGKIHDSAGTAIREQFNENRHLAGSLVVSPDFAFGYRWIDGQGNVHEDQNYAVTRIMDLTNCTAIKFRLYQYNNDSDNKHLAMIAYYDQELKHIASLTQIAEANGIVEATVTPLEDAKYAIVSLYKPIGNGYAKFYYSVDAVKNGDTINKTLNLCEFPTSNGYIRTDGVVVADENWVHTDYIPVEEGKKLELSMHGHKAVNSVSYYDINKTLIGAVVADIEYIVGTTEKFKYGIETIPENTAFVRLCYRIGASTISRCKYTVNAGEVMNKIQQHDTAIKELYSELGIIAQTTEKVLAGKTVFLAGDSRSSTDYSFYGEAMKEKTGASVIVGGASGWKTSAIASNSYFTRLINNAHDFSIWLVGGNDTGESGTVGTFDNTSVNSIGGERVVEETDVSIDYNGNTFVQAVDHIMRKYKALFYDWKSLNNGHKPKMIFCTDIPQKRSGGDLTWSLPDNWERKRQAIIECCKKNNVACLDLYALCNFDMDYEPEWTSPTDMVNNNGLYFMDGLHPNKHGIDIITSLEIEEIKKHLTIY